MKLLTYEDWRANCRHVMRGEVSTKRNAQGQPLFSYDQTEPDYESPTDHDFYCGD